MNAKKILLFETTQHAKPILLYFRQTHRSMDYKKSFMSVINKINYKTHHVSEVDFQSSSRCN